MAAKDDRQATRSKTLADAGSSWPEVLVGVGGQIRKLRVAKGLTQAQLAEAIGMSRPSLSKIERGVENFGVATLFSLAAALDVEPGALLVDVAR